MRKKATLAIGITALVLICVLAFFMTSILRGRAAGNSAENSQSSLITVQEGSSDYSRLGPEEGSSEAAGSSGLSQSSALDEKESSRTGTETSQKEETTSDSRGEAETSDAPGQVELSIATQGQSYDDINTNVLTCLLTKDMSGLADYVASDGLTLCPTGGSSPKDLTLSKSDVADFFDGVTRTYGTYSGSGYGITMTPDQYYSKYMVPGGFDFSASVTAYDDPSDLSAAGGLGSHTISYYYAPDPVGWMKVILVYQAQEGAGDALRAIIYQDTTTN
jgi:hypothetical protein